MKISISSLLGRPSGTIQKFALDEAIHFPQGHLDLTEHVTGQIQLLKLPNEINVQIKNLATVAKTICSRCLISILIQIKIPLVDREFIIDVPERDLELGEEVFYVNQHTNEIELDDMVREELLLHFPAIPLCLGGCKGLCDQCGANRNETTCSCVPSESASHPFKFLG